MKGNNNPVPDVLEVMTAVGILFDKKPEGKMDAATGKKNYIWWPTIQKMLMQLDFLDQVKGFEKEKLDVKTIEMIKPYLAKPNFDPV